MHPEGSEGTWRDLPGLLGDSIRLVWSSGRNTFLLTSSLQLLTAVGVVVQLFVAKAVFESVLGSGGNADLAGVGPPLVALVGVTVALDLARAIRDEQGRVLGELVGRKAIDRVLDVSTRIDLLAFESPEFYDRLQRARAQGQFRALQTVNGLLGIVGSLMTSAAIIFALAALAAAAAALRAHRVPATLGRRLPEHARPLPLLAGNDAERSAAQLPPERAHGPERGEGGARFQPGRVPPPPLRHALRRADRRAAAAREAQDGPGAARLDHVVGGHGRDDRDAGVALHDRPHVARGGRGGGLRPLPAREPAARGST